MSWRPEDWENKGDLYRNGYEVYEAGADAILEALRSIGNHYSNLPECCRIIYDVAWHGGSGTTVFIPDEEV